MTPIIGIPASNWPAEEGSRYFIGEDYIRAVAQAGGTPVILPPIRRQDAVNRQIMAVDGLLLAGGCDLDPLLFGEEPLPQLGRVFPERDEYELLAVKLARRRRIPILGVCRGIQVINVAFGGSLFQDLAAKSDPVLQHCQQSRKDVPGHTVVLLAGSLLQEIFAEDQVRTNSFHHQAVREPAPGFVVSAWAKDGVIEGIELAADDILGVQWHPEAMAGRHPAMLGLFGWLVGAARRRRRECRPPGQEPGN